MENKTTVIAEEGKQELFVIREFEASREKVFRAFTDPEILVKFFAPNDYIMEFNHHDYRTGGSYSWINKTKEGQVLCTFAGVIHELTAPERFIYTAEFMELPERGHVILEQIKFEEISADRTKVVIHDVCFSVETRDAMIKSGMESGLVSIFNKLDELLLA